MPRLYRLSVSRRTLIDVVVPDGTTFGDLVAIVRREADDLLEHVVADVTAERDVKAITIREAASLPGTSWRLSDPGDVGRLTRDEVEWIEGVGR